MAAVTVDFPLWREHSRSVRSALDLRSLTCHESGGIPACSMMAAGSRRSSRFRASTREPLHRFRHSELCLGIILESGLDRDGDDCPLLRVHDSDRPRVPELRRLCPAGLAVALPSRAVAEPVERLVSPNLDLRREPGLCSRGAHVVRKRAVGLSLVARTLA